MAMRCGKPTVGRVMPTTAGDRLRAVPVVASSAEPDSGARHIVDVFRPSMGLDYAATSRIWIVPGRGDRPSVATK